MSTNTTNMAMGKAVDGDNAKTYLETTLGAALDKIDAHDHSGTTHGLNTFTGGLTISASGITVTGNSTITGTLTGLTGVGITGNSTLVGTLTGLTGIGATAGPHAITGLMTLTGPGATSGTNALIVNNSTPSALLTVRDDGLVTMPFLPARVAGDLYVIIDASGNLHKSAVGPAS